nr:hypothetical protein [Tanacetum cinerariifolium]
IILDTYGERVILKRRRDDDDDDQGEGPSAGSDRGSKRQRERKELKSASALLQTATRSAGRSSHSSRTSYAVAANLSEMELNKSIQRSDEQRNLYKALIDAYEADKTILDSYGEIAILKRQRAGDQPIFQTSQHPEWFPLPKKPPTPDRDWYKTLPAVQGSAQTWIREPAKQADSRSSFNELLDTPIDFSNFIMNRLGIDTLTPELLAGPTYKLMRGSCNILSELEYHLEEVYKATTDQLDWVNPEGQ